MCIFSCSFIPLGRSRDSLHPPSLEIDRTYLGLKMFLCFKRKFPRPLLGTGRSAAMLCAFPGMQGWPSSPWQCVLEEAATQHPTVAWLGAFSKVPIRSWADVHAEAPVTIVVMWSPQVAVSSSLRARCGWLEVPCGPAVHRSQQDSCSEASRQKAARVLLSLQTSTRQLPLKHCAHLSERERSRQDVA